MLRSIFGPSKKAIWSQIAADIGGDFSDGGFWGKDVLSYKHEQWQILLDTYVVSTGKSSTTYTRMRAPFVNKDEFRFTIYREGFFSSLGKLLGMQDIEIGDPLFDSKFIIKSNDTSKIKLLLDDNDLKQLVELQPRIHLEIKDDEGWFGPSFPEGVDELRFQCIGVIKDADILKSLFDLFSIILTRLVQIDSAYEDDPNVTLK